MNKLSKIIDIANVHGAKIIDAKAHISKLFPVDKNTMTNLSKIDFLWIELLVSRFGKLQDILGAKIIPLFFEEHQTNIQNMTMLDIINLCEKVGIIKNAALWKEMRSIRNHVESEYPDHPELIALYLNQLYDLIPELLSILDNIEKRMAKNNNG